MSQWKNDDSAANSVLWGVSQYKKTANATNRNAFFGNTTANAYFDGVTVGQFGVDTDEQTAARAAGARAAHAGWVVKTEGQGGRAGRVQMETLVAMGSMTGDAEDVTFPDTFISITSQPVDASANGADNEQATFTVVATSTPSKTLTYLWTYANGDSIGAETSNVSTASLVIDANTATDQDEYKVEISATGAINVESSNVTLTVTT